MSGLRTRTRSTVRRKPVPVVKPSDRGATGGVAAPRNLSKQFLQAKIAHKREEDDDHGLSYDGMQALVRR